MQFTGTQGAICSCTRMTSRKDALTNMTIKSGTLQIRHGNDDRRRANIPKKRASSTETQIVGVTGRETRDSMRTMGAGIVPMGSGNKFTAIKAQCTALPIGQVCRSSGAKMTIN